MVIPAFVVVFYAIFIFAKGKNVIHAEQLGDSVYYLGFILTLFALIFALYDMSGNLAAKVIIPKFGIALVTTVVGIGIRVYVTQFMPTQEDVSEITEKQLTDTALNFKNTSRCINKKHSEILLTKQPAKLVKHLKKTP